MTTPTHRACPVCATPSAAARLFMRQNIDTAKVSAFSFASRKLPEFMCHQLVQCPTCDLVYADQPPDQAVLAQAYHVASFDSADEADDAARAYEKAVLPVLAQLARKEAAFEIGTGTGIFLDVLRKQGFTSTLGVEPSAAAIAAAPAHRQGWIREDIFRESDYAPESFDFLCCFMTLEHVRDPHDIVAAASRLLRPGGAIALVTHDYRSGVNRLLGKRSPIIDIEHMQLFSQASIRALLQRNGYTGIAVASFRNRYALRYWIRLLPLGVPAKQRLIRVLAALGLADLKLSFNVGNILSVAFRPPR
jgi:SAM-dependent methyltransferase